MKMIKNDAFSVCGLTPAPIDQKSVLEDALLDLLFDDCRYILNGNKSVGFVNNLATIASCHENVLTVSLIPNTCPEEEVREWETKVVSSITGQELEMVKKFEFVSLFTQDGGLVYTYVVTHGVVEFQFHFNEE